MARLCRAPSIGVNHSQSRTSSVTDTDHETLDELDLPVLDVLEPTLPSATHNMVTRSHGTNSEARTISALQIKSESRLLDALSDGPLEDIKGMDDITAALESGRNAILEAVQVHEAVASHSALVIEGIWNYFSEMLLQYLEHANQIRRWQKSIRKERSVDKYLALADGTRKQIESRIGVIEKNWGVSPTEVMAQEGYARQSFGKSFLSLMAQLSGEVTLEQGRLMLRQEMTDRQSKKNTSLTITDTQLKRRDIATALKKTGMETTKKRKRVQPVSKTVKKPCRQSSAASSLPMRYSPESSLANQKDPNRRESSPSRMSASPSNSAAEESTTRTERQRGSSEAPSIELARRQPSQTLDDDYDMGSEENVTNVSVDQSQPKSPPLLLSPPSPSENDLLVDTSLDLIQHQKNQLSSMHEEHELGVSFEQEVSRLGSSPEPAEAGRTSPLRSRSAPAPMHSKPQPSDTRPLSAPCRLPTTDLAGALESLAPRMWLSATAIQMILEMITPDDWSFVDSTAVRLPTIAGLVATRAHGKKGVLLPIHFNDHWTLISLDFENTTAHVLDSRSKGYTHHLSEILNAALSRMQTANSWTIRRYDKFCQLNGFDCGIFVLVGALCMVGHHPLPASASQVVSPSLTSRETAAVTEKAKLAEELKYMEEICEQLRARITVGLARSLDGIRRGRAELDDKAQQLEEQRVKAEKCIRGWHAAIELCELTCADEENRLRLAKDKLREKKALADDLARRLYSISQDAEQLLSDSDTNNTNQT
ncbi:MAG: hypothetical protein Q9219_007363 [cf. Caloplaca sp. 3 TL-2023]